MADDNDRERGKSLLNRGHGATNFGVIVFRLKVKYGVCRVKHHQRQRLVKGIGIVGAGVTHSPSAILVGHGPNRFRVEALGGEHPHSSLKVGGARAGEPPAVQRVNSALHLLDRLSDYDDVAAHRGAHQVISRAKMRSRQRQRYHERGLADAGRSRHNVDADAHEVVEDVLENCYAIRARKHCATQRERVCGFFAGAGNGGCVVARPAGVNR